MGSPTEHDRLSNGQFATKEVGNSGRFKKGHPKKGGRKPGTPNRATRAVKEFLAAMVDEVDVQEAVRDRITRGDAVAFFRALEHVIGKPKESHDLTGELHHTFKWQD